MLAELQNKLLVVQNTETGEQSLLQISFEPDGIMVIADAGEEVPRFVHRMPMDAFPTDDLVMTAICKAMRAPVELVQVVHRGMELDSSVFAGLRKMPVDIFDNVYLDEVKPSALILCVDVRNFSSFLCKHAENDVFKLIKDFTSNFLSCVNQFGYGCSYYKLMGDGAIVIWDDTNERSVSESLQVFDTYIDFVNEELFKPYGDLGLAGALVTDKVFKYEISAETSQLKYRDYIGYGINLACRIQALARKDELVINHNLADTGLVPFTTVSSRKALRELRQLKGLKIEDCADLLYYDRRQTVRA